MENKEIVIFIPSIEKGGVEKNFFIIANYLSRKFKKVSLITADKIKTNYSYKNLNIFSQNSIIYSRRNRILKSIIASFYLIKKIFSSKKIIIFSFQSNLWAIIISILFNIKVIIRSNSSSEIWAKNYVKRKIFSFFLKYANNIIVNSKELKIEFKKKFNINSDLIYNPLNKKEIIAKSKKKNHKKLFLSTKKVLKILNIGRITEQKNQILILKAIKLLKDSFKFEVIILGNGKLKKKLLDYILFNNLEKIVKIKDFKKNPYKAIKEADLFILTSIFEGLPNVLLEAIVLKKPIISSDCPTGPKEILEDGKFGILFKNNNFLDLASKIRKFSENRKMYERKTSIAYKSLSKYDLSKNLKKYESLIKNI